MIVIAGSPFQIAGISGGYPENSVEGSFEQMSQSAEVYRYDTVEQPNLSLPCAGKSSTRQRRSTAAGSNSPFSTSRNAIRVLGQNKQRRLRLKRSEARRRDQGHLHKRPEIRNGMRHRHGDRVLRALLEVFSRKRSTGSFRSI